MNLGIVSMRYARALLAYATERKVEDAIYADMLQLSAVVGEVRELVLTLQNPVLTFAEKVDLLCSTVEESYEFRNFASLIIKHGREELLGYIAHGYITLYRKQKNIVAAKLTTPLPLGDAMREKIAAIIARACHATVELENVADSTIIGGFIYDADSLRYDASVKGKLQKIEKQMVKQNKRLI